MGSANPNVNASSSPHSPHGMHHHHGIPPLKLDELQSMHRTMDRHQSLQKQHHVPPPPLKMDDFNVGFGGGSGYGAAPGTEWMDLMSDLQPCESTESSALPVVVSDAWENDFPSPRELP